MSGSRLGVYFANGPIADTGLGRKDGCMSANFTPTAAQQAILERLRVPERIEVTLQRPSFALDANELRLCERRSEELARGFDPDYELTAEGA